MKAFEGYVQADYSSENWMILLNAKAEGDMNIDNATSVEEVMSALKNAQAAMAAVKTLLDYAKEAAHQSLNAALAGYAKDDYSQENWAILLNLAADTDNAASVSDVMTALNNAKSAMAAVNTLLIDAKILAHTSLNSALAAYSQADYSPDNWAVLNGLKEAGDAAIDAALDLATVEAAQSAAVTGMEGVQTIARILAALKSSARGALAAVFKTYTESDYTADDWTVLKGFKEAGDKAIDAALDLAEVEAAQSAAIAQMEGVQAFAWILDAAKSAAREALTEVFGTYTESDYTADDWMVLVGFKEAGDTAIDAALDLAEVEMAQSAAVMEMEGVKTIAGILEAAKSTAHGALESVFKTYTESDYTADDWTALNALKETGDAAIDAALDLDEVETAQSAAVKGMEGVETIARILEAAKSAAHETLAAAFEADTGSSGIVDDVTDSNNTVGDVTDSNNTVGDDTQSNAIVDDDTDNDTVDGDTETNVTVDDATECNDTADGDTRGDDAVGDYTESNDTADDDRDSGDTAEGDTESNATVDDDTENNAIVDDATECNDTVDGDTESSDTIDDGSDLTDLIPTGDTEMNAVTETEQIEEPPAADVPDGTRQKRSRTN